MGPLMGWLDAFMKRRKMEGFMYMVISCVMLTPVSLVFLTTGTGWSSIVLYVHWDRLQMCVKSYRLKRAAN